jgi:hypothetical protein
MVPKVKNALAIEEEKGNFTNILAVSEPAAR